MKPPTSPTATGRLGEPPEDGVDPGYLNRNIRVIPVVVGGAPLPRPEELPEPLSRLVQRHAVSLDNETWELGVSKIVGAFVQPTDPQPPPPTPPTRRPYAETSAGPPSRPHPSGAIIAILVAALVLAAGVGATVVVLSLQRSSSAGVATPASLPSPPAPTSTAPPATTNSPETTAPTRPPTTHPPRTTAPIPPAQVVARYYDAINARDYQAAWALVGGSKFGQTYDEFTAGFANTAHDTLRITGVNGSTVAVQLVATHHDGSIRTYRGTYTVLAGRIIEGNLRRLS